MASAKKRIMVDGIDFASVFRFPRILRSVTSAMQPPRLVVALLMVVLLVVFGRTWDASTTPRVHPEGFLKGEMTADQIAGARDIMWHAIERYVDEDDRPPREQMFNAREVQKLIDAGYRTRRMLRQTGRTIHGEETPGVPQAVLEVDDQQFLAAATAISEVAPKGAFEGAVLTVTDCFNRTVQGVIFLRPQMIFEAWTDLFIRLPVALWQQQRAFAIVFGIFFLLVGSIGGGALCRMAACEFAGQERLRVRDAFDFALGNWVKLVMTPLLPLMIAGIVALLMFVPGLLMLPWLDVAAALLYVVALLLGFVLAFLLLGYAVGLPMLLPAVACENCDAVDAQQRAYAYVLNRPLHLLGYAAMALIGLALGYVLVAMVGAALLNFAAVLGGALTGNTAMSAAGGFEVFDLSQYPLADFHPATHNKWAASIISFWQQVVVFLIVAYVIAYLFIASTMVYLLMRQACDGQDMQEIWRPGLAPGTLVPLPRPMVEPTDEAEARQPGGAERVLSGAMRKAAGARFKGGRSAADEDDEAPENVDAAEKKNDAEETAQE